MEQLINWSIINTYFNALVKICSDFINDIFNEFLNHNFSFFPEI